MIRKLYPFFAGAAVIGLAVLPIINDINEKILRNTANPNDMYFKNFFFKHFKSTYTNIIGRTFTFIFEHTIEYTDEDITKVGVRVEKLTKHCENDIEVHQFIKNYIEKRVSA